MFFTIVTFVVVLAVLVLIHEFGHFYAARKAGVRVEEFGFGFPPRLFGVKRGDTLYSFNLLPLGGFVRLYGEDDPDLGEESFGAKSLFARTIIVAAGVIANVLLAMVIFTIVAAIGAPTIATEDGAQLENSEVRVVAVSENSPASEIGLEIGDQIVGLQSSGGMINVTTTSEVREYIAARHGEKVDLLVRRGGETVALSVTPRTIFPEDEGSVGFAMAEIGFERTPWYLAPIEGVRRTFELLWLIVAFLGQLVAALFVGGGGELAGSVSGPVGIANVVGDSLRFGFVYLLEIVGLLSVNLAVLNILPIPALDGGRLAFFAIEKIRGRELEAHVPRIAHNVGFLLLIGILLIVTYRDIVQLF